MLSVWNWPKVITLSGLYSKLLSDRAGVLNLLVLVYPQIKIVPLCVPPNQTCILFAYPQIKNSTQINFIWVFFLNFVYPCGLLTYPLWPLHVPLGVRVPQVENRCDRAKGAFHYQCPHLLSRVVTFFLQTQSFLQPWERTIKILNCV